MKLLSENDIILLTRTIVHNANGSFNYVLNDITIEELTRIYNTAPTGMSTVGLKWRLESWDDNDTLAGYRDYPVGMGLQSTVWVDTNNTPYDPYNVNPVKHWVRAIAWATPEDVVMPGYLHPYLQFP